MNAERILAASQYVGSGPVVHRPRRRVRQGAGRLRPADRHEPGHPVPDRDRLRQPARRQCLRWQAAEKFEAGSRSGTEANIAKLLSSKAQWEAANAAMDTFGGYGLASEYGVEQKFRAARGPLIAPISTNLILAGIAQRDLGMPRSY